MHFENYQMYFRTKKKIEGKNRSQSINFTECKRNRIYEIFVKIQTIMITIRRYIIHNSNALTRAA